MLQKLLELLIGQRQERINGGTQNQVKTATDSYNETLYESEINKQGNVEFQNMNEKECINTIEEQKEKQDINANIIDTNLFKNEQETKEEKIKEVLQLEHTAIVENENYEFPPIELLKEREGFKKNKKEVIDAAVKLQKTLYDFGISAKIEKVTIGPAFTRYEIKLAEGVRVSEINRIEDDIALRLAAKAIRIEAPIPGKEAVGIEIPNQEREEVKLREIIDTDIFKNNPSKSIVGLGKNIEGKEIIIDIKKVPHLLISGATGSGKSICIHTIINSILYKAKPSEVKFILIDSRVLELSMYNGIPHLLIPVITDSKKAVGALDWGVHEMERRYTTLAKEGVKDLNEYNKIVEREKLPNIIIIIDEFADLLLTNKRELEEKINILSRKSAKVGIHLIITTQRPSTDIITGTIKANIPSRIAFAVSSQTDSRIILDEVGAEKLLKEGDMLYYPIGALKPERIQGAYIESEEIRRVIHFIKGENIINYDMNIIKKIEEIDTQEQEEYDDESDPFLMEAIDVVVETGQASTSFIQRRFKVGYARAGRIIDQMEERGVISGFQGSEPREVLMSKERWEELKNSTI